MNKADSAKFITRGKHEQHPGYAPWLAHALTQLGHKPLNDLLLASVRALRENLPQIIEKAQNHAARSGDNRAGERT